MRAIEKDATAIEFRPIGHILAIYGSCNTERAIENGAEVRVGEGC
jgi:hypothetical protein